jgi:hypothetical protein
MTIKFADRVKVSTSSTGTGTISLGSAVDGFQTFAQGGILNGNSVRYTITNGDSWEVGTGVYASSGNSMTRSYESSSTGSLLNLSGTSEVFITVASADINNLADTVPKSTGGQFDANVDFAAGIDVTGNITVTGTVDGRDVATDGTKLDGVEASATADQTAAEIRALVESATDSNVFTDADHSKLNAIEASATADQTGAEIKTLYQAEANAYTDAKDTKLSGIETGATADQTAAEIRTLVESATDSNVFTDADHSKLNAIEAGATGDQTNAEIRAAVEAATDSNVFTDADHSKLDAIEASADVTDTTNVTAAGALMDSEVTNLAQVKAFDSSDYATAAQGTTADAALPKSGGAMTGAITTNSTFDGRDVAADGTKLDGIAAGANVGIGSLAADSSPQLGGVLDVNGQAIDFGDDEHLRLGNNNEHRIYHKGNGSTLRIEATSAGKSIEVRGVPSSNSFFSVLDANGTNIIKATMNGSSSGVTLHHGGGTKLATSSSGITVTGTLAATAVTGDGSGLTNLPAQSDNTKMPLAGGTFTGDVTLEGASYDVTWDSSDNALEFGSLAKAKFNSNLEIFGATHSEIHNTSSGNQLIIRQNAPDQDINLMADAGNGTFQTVYVKLDGSEGEVLLYHYGTEKLATKSTGIDVSGNIAVSGTVDGRDIASDGTKLDGIAAGANVGIPTTGGTFTGGVTLFTGTVTDRFVLNDNVPLRIGTGHDFTIMHNGTNTIITGDAIFEDTIKIKQGGVLAFTTSSNVNRSIIQFDGTRTTWTNISNYPIRIDGSFEVVSGSSSIASFETTGVDLYYSNSKKFETTSTGVDITGTLTSDGLTVDATTSTAVQANADAGYSLFNGSTNSSGARINISGASASSGIAINGYNAAQNGYTPLNYLAADHRFKIGSSEKMRLDASGNLLVGKTTTAFGTDGTHINSSGYLEVTNTSGELLYLNRLSNDGDLIRLYKDSAQVGSISSVSSRLKVSSNDAQGYFFLNNGTADASNKLWLNGSLLAWDNSAYDIGGSTTKFKDLYLSGTANAANFNSTSDATLKTNVETLSGSLDAVMSMRGVSFDWVESGAAEIGVIAQEVEEVVPDVVNTNGEGIKSVKYGNLVGVLIEAIKEQQTQIDELKSKIGK